MKLVPQHDAREPIVQAPLEVMPFPALRQP